MGRPIEVSAIEFDGERVSAQTTNVFFEFSPLEYGEWHLPDRIEVPRGVWIMDDQRFLYVTFYIGVSRTREEEEGVILALIWSSDARAAIALPAAVSLLPGAGKRRRITA